MLVTLARFFLRLFILLLAFFSIFYFYILQYRFDSKLGFVKTSWVYSLESLDLPFNDEVILNWKKYKLAEDKLVLHNMFSPKSCGKIKIWNYQDFLCYKDAWIKHIVYVSKNVLKLLPAKNLTYFKKLELISSDNIGVKYTFSWHKINFSYYKNWDLIYKDDISAKKLINLPNLEFVWYDNKWLYVVKDGSLYFMKLVR